MNLLGNLMLKLHEWNRARLGEAQLYEQIRKVRNRGEFDLVSIANFVKADLQRNFYP